MKATAWALGLLVTLVAITTASGDNPSVPEAVHGRWLAIDGRHAGRVLGVTCVRVLLQQGPGSFASHRITEVRAERSRAGTRYEIEFMIAGGNRDVLSFVADPDEPDVMRMERTRDRWMKTSEVRVPWEGSGLEGCPDD